MGWPFWGRDIGEKESQELAELCAEKLRQALPDYADFIKVGDQPNQGDGRILRVIKLEFEANYKNWIAEKPVKESKRVELIGDVQPLIGALKASAKPGGKVKLSE